MILADTSAWIEFDRGTDSRVALRMRELALHGEELAVTEPVVAEVLAGARDDERKRQLRRLLGSFSWLPFDATVHFDGAVTVYRWCRSAGVTPRGLIDCMIVAVALSSDAAILARDRDLVRIAGVVPLNLDAATTG